MSPTEILTAAREKIATPDAWCKDDYSRDGKRFCAVGAIQSAAGCLTFRRTIEFHRATNALASAIGGSESDTNEGHILIWNDAPERTHAEVLAAFDRAIEESKSCD